jgi:hypothetical protein
MRSDNPVDEFLAALEKGQWGTFPFGQPNAQCAPTQPSDGSEAALVVLGVYPSALHLSWRAPDGKASIAALAVDVEPSVFWAGDNESERAQRVAGWKTATNDDGSRGIFGWAAFNGSSGSAVAHNYLDPLGVSYEQCFLTDCVPFYFVKSGTGEQGTAISAKWKRYADENDWIGGDLPSRPTTKALVSMAASPERGLEAELVAAQPAVVVTLGQEAADALERVVPVMTPPAGLPLRAGDDGYGSPGWITLGEHEVKWIPLAHPGVTGRKGSWHDHHDKWTRTARHLLDE